MHSHANPNRREGDATLIDPTASQHPAAAAAIDAARLWNPLAKRGTPLPGPGPLPTRFNETRAAITAARAGLTRCTLQTAASDSSAPNLVDRTEQGAYA
jgi:hypothetical protein